ncbi:hypothetical protein [Bifidobacterium sp. SO1]|uniref:hypothetical protein n=1 Tax=Bifidobacterium sp. SO1 TaxID=2809029 RepID=UPI001BDC3BB0|nr:hypothetical protein [Bifidobacterium sp. SO1]MBT1161785.1 hypothetical protein [Bifidobacterium sp. SO1]
MTGLEYTPRTLETGKTRELWERALPPKENILYPKDLDDLLRRWKTIARNRGLTEAELSDMTGLDESIIRTAMTTGKATVTEAMRITEALGYSLKRIPYGLKGN